jgi:hypothetical protein
MNNLRGTLSLSMEPARILYGSTDGSNFDLGIEAKAKGRRAYKSFVRRCGALDPLYAAMTAEWELETPDLLVDDEGSYNE